MVKSVQHIDGTRRFFGRRRPIARYPRLHLKNYLTRAIPIAPNIWSWRRLALEALAQMYMNDSLGDCVIACLEHNAGVLTGNATNGNPVIFDDGNTVRLYSAIGGYVPGDSSTDNGCDIQTALNYYGTSGLSSNGSHKIVGYLAVNPSDVEEIKQAIFLFGNLCFGVELPDAWINPNFPSGNGFTWDIAGAPDPNNGHCFLGFGHNSSGVQINTWALQGIMTYAAIAQYCNANVQGELYTVISQDILIAATQKAPNGFDFTQLMADFQAIKA